MTEASLLRVGFFSYNNWPWQRQLPNKNGVVGSCQFVFDGEEPLDYIVVYDGCAKDMSFPLPRERTLFVATEPTNVKRYSPRFTAQFGTLISADDKDPHPRKIMTQAALTWHYGIKSAQPESYKDALDFNAIEQNKNLHKTKDVSIICSNKDLTPEHRQRKRFVNELKSIMGDRIDVFGRGFREIEDKAEVLDSYRYHVALENCDFANFWTEKIADPFLGHTFPFYWGCSNLEDYFPADSFLRLDIEKPREAASIISYAINNNLYEKRLKAIEEARRRVLYEHNLFSMLEREIQCLHKEESGKKATGCVSLRMDTSGRIRTALARFPVLLHIARALIKVGRGLFRPCK